MKDTEKKTNKCRNEFVNSDMFIFHNLFILYKSHKIPNRFMYGYYQGNPKSYKKNYSRIINKTFREKKKRTMEFE